MREISFGKFMTILDLWYLIAKSSKNFTGGKDKVSAIVVAIVNVTKTLHVKAMSSPLGWIWTIDNTTVYYKLLNIFSYDLFKFTVHLIQYYINGLSYNCTFLLVYWMNLDNWCNTRACVLWQYGLGSFQAGGTKLERFFIRIIIPKGNHWILSFGLMASCQK